MKEIYQVLNKSSIKNRLSKMRLDNFRASNWRLKILKLSYGLVETHGTGEADDTPHMNEFSIMD